MSYRCEHGKDSDICVQCWEEKNLEPKIMNCLKCGKANCNCGGIIITNSQTPLQKAIEELDPYLFHDKHGWNESFKKSIRTVIAAAKQLDGLQDAFIKQHEQLEALQTENEKFRAQHKATEELLFDSICINKVKHDTSEEGCIYCKCDSLKSALEAMTKERDGMENELAGNALVLLSFQTQRDEAKEQLKSTRAENVDDQVALEAIDHVTSDDFCEDLEMRDDLDGYLKIAHEKLSLIYRISHSQCRGHSCCGVHDSWRELKHEVIKSTTPPTTTDNKEDVK